MKDFIKQNFLQMARAKTPGSIQPYWHDDVMKVIRAEEPKLQESLKKVKVFVISGATDIEYVGHVNTQKNFKFKENTLEKLKQLKLKGIFRKAFLEDGGDTNLSVGKFFETHHEDENTDILQWPHYKNALNTLQTYFHEWGHAFQQDRWPEDAKKCVKSIPEITAMNLPKALENQCLNIISTHQKEVHSELFGNTCTLLHTAIHTPQNLEETYQKLQNIMHERSYASQYNFTEIIYNSSYAVSDYFQNLKKEVDQNTCAFIKGKEIDYNALIASTTHVVFEKAFSKEEMTQLICNHVKPHTDGKHEWLEFDASSEALKTQKHINLEKHSKQSEEASKKAFSEEEVVHNKIFFHAYQQRFPEGQYNDLPDRLKELAQEYREIVQEYQKTHPKTSRQNNR